MEYLVVGDLHGDFETFRQILKIFESKKKARIIFLGDYGDRGEKGLEIIESLIRLKKQFEERIILLKGNHEDYSEEGEWYWAPCTLPLEVEEKRKVPWKEYFRNYLYPNFFSTLKLFYLIPNFALFVHAGISSKIKSLSDLKNPSKDLYLKLLWSDPFEGNGELPNPRGLGILFGEDVTEKVLKALGVKIIIRAHEPGKAREGFWVEHKGKVITLSSTRVYGGIPAIMEIDPKERKIEFLRGPGFSERKSFPLSGNG